MELFFKFASPTTLASLISDLQQQYEWTESIDAMHQTCMDELVAIVGDTESESLLVKAGWKPPATT